VPEERDVKNINTWKLITSRPDGGPKIKWMDNERHPDNEDC
jgi:hypothetical protein